MSAKSARSVIQPVLFNPGPVVLSTRVRNALARPDICHREAEFAELQCNIHDALLRVYPLTVEDWDVALLSGSGTCAMEAMICSMVPDNGKVLVATNGVYGERLARIAAIHQIETICLDHPWEAAWDIPRIEQTLAQHSDITHIAVVHHETTTGRLNDLAALATACAPYRVRLLVDAVSSFAAEAIDFTQWNIAACAAAANKCLHGVTGCSFVVVNREQQQQAAKHTSARSLYLDLHSNLQQQRKQSTAFTPAIHSFYALEEALQELADNGGWQMRQELYQQRLLRVREGMQECGIAAFLPLEECSCVLQAFYLPANTSYQALHGTLREAGFVIYAGQGTLSHNLFRISCMGEIAMADIDRFISVMHDTVS